jgi:ABC-2 type transport system ATP-binding protein
MAFTRTVGVVFGQRTQLWWDIAVVESFRLLKEIYEVSDADYRARMARFDEILELKRYLHQPVRKLSLGERMRCDMAAALLHNPPLLYLDEPTIGLDLLAKENIRQFLKEVNRDFNTTVLLTTHDLTDIEELCQRLMIIDHGKILFDGPLHELKRMLWRQGHIRFELKSSDQGPALDVLALPNIRLDKVDDLTYLASFDREDHTAGDVIRRVVSAVDVRDIYIEEESIEEIVRRIYTGGAVEELQKSR